MNLYEQAFLCLMHRDTSEKQSMVAQLRDAWEKGELDRKDSALIEIPVPGRPDRPDLLNPGLLKQRKLGSELGRATLVHAILHIEFNAINLALDAVYRFRDMPEAYYSDWLKVAAEEAYHFSLLEKRLADLGYAYGDFPAHNGLWEMVLKTDHDVLIRMALVPRVLEARGLDVTPGMIERFLKAGDNETVDILRIILNDEIGHVAIGSRWFKYCCANKELNPEETFRNLLIEYMGKGLSGPFHEEARLQAGFTQEEIDELVKMV
ncbi:ferritin-like domain-containing protein [Cocleimonas sp. KMM 6892]|uniref:ferritin-like domain-containing protein n=1 Tax=unclassified Cocleimonas TaxID=2639732 RepID=UPI002DB989D4|nr:MULTISPECIES: ferritin-like domain-containing protein [unclassified Cocleimonas]MEB8433462.1 ferritin-like domain-containing protein [Cocleimonas sp. KMM 6892]MEC4716273.1 ferritin-like domain-containing protein [Cocleimonas sp. KMM 6895]MEC4745834.1 ferritin-like domain-containing protein [Cocleimonas sp. KMM 6896]